MTKSLLSKLGWRPGTPTLVWCVPKTLQPILAPLIESTSGTPTFLIAFSRNRADLANAAAEVAARYVTGGHLWLCYPKKSGRIDSDLTRDVGWEPVHALDLIGVAQIAIDDDWSGLRFRKRSEVAKITRKEAFDVRPPTEVR